jgi:hypothetical protein
MQANTWTLCNAKIGIGKHVTPAPTYKGLKKEFHSTNNVEHKFWLCPNVIKHYVSESKKKLCTRLAYNTQQLALEDTYESLEGAGVGSQRLWVPIIAR